MCSTHFAEEAAPTTGRDGAHAHLRHARRTSHPNCTPCRGPHVKSACAWLCTGTPTDVKSDDLQATMCSTPLVCTTWYHAVPPLPPCRTSATATHAAGDCARAPSGHNGCPRWTNCLPPGPDASSDCGDFAEEALGNTPCDGACLFEAAAAAGHDGVRAHLRHTCRLSHPSCKPCRGPDVKSACAWL